MNSYGFKKTEGRGPDEVSRTVSEGSISQRRRRDTLNNISFSQRSWVRVFFGVFGNTSYVALVLEVASSYR